MDFRLENVERLIIMRPMKIPNPKLLEALKQEIAERERNIEFRESQFDQKRLKLRDAKNRLKQAQEK